MLSMLKVIFRPDAATCVFFGSIATLVIMVGIAMKPPQAIVSAKTAEAARVLPVSTTPTLLRDGWQTTIEPRSGS